MGPTDPNPSARRAALLAKWDPNNSKRITVWHLNTSPEQGRTYVEPHFGSQLMSLQKAVQEDLPAMVKGCVY